MIKKIFLLLMFLPLSLFAWKMESGTINLPATTTGSSTWQSITLQQTYDTVPLIFALPDDGNGSYNSDSPAALRVRSVETGSFEIVQVEPQSDEADEVEGEHAAMTIHYIAIEPGDHTLPDGTRIFAGTHDTTTKQGKNVSNPKDWDNIVLAPAFTSIPLVISMIQSLVNENNTLPGDSSSPWMTAHIKDVETDNFDITLDRAETSFGSINNNETIGYLAIDSASSGTIFDTTCKSISYQTINTGDNVQGWDNGCYSQSFGKTYAGNPNVIGSMQSRDGGDGGWLRRCSLSDSAVGITVDEDQADDSDRRHTKEIVGLVVFSQNFAYDSTFNSLGCGLAAEYRMDECYWLGSSHFDMIDHVGKNNAEVYNDAQPDPSNVIVNFSGGFGTTGYFQPESTLSIDNDWTYALWIKFPLDSTGHDEYSISGTNSNNKYYYHALGSIIGDGDLPAIIKENGGSDLMWELYDSNGDDTVADLPDDLGSTNNGWHHFIFVQENSEISLYLDGTFHNKISSSITGTVEGYLTSFDAQDAQTVGSNVDELKLWNIALLTEEVNAIYQNENQQLNYDGTSRQAVTCDASISANTWEMIGIPVDPRAGAIGVQDVFGDDFDGSKYDNNTDGWILFKKVYSDTNNSAHYEKVDYVNNETIDFGRGYWLRSTSDATWDVEGLPAVNYDSTYNETTYCPGSRCVEVDLTTTSSDGSEGTGIRRFNLNGFIGINPVEWADCYFIVSDLDGSNVEVLTPEEADTAGYASSTISLWSGGQGSGTGGQVIGSDYTECTDTTPGGCTMQPFHGVWIELFTNTTGKKVKLLIPEE